MNSAGRKALLSAGTIARNGQVNRKYPVDSKTLIA
jgi:hypothetical protein